MLQFLVLWLLLSASAVVTGLNVSFNGEPYILSNGFDGNQAVLTWTDLNSNNPWVDSDYPGTYLVNPGANVSADSLWTFEKTSNGTIHIYNGHYPNKDYRLDVIETYTDSSETAIITLPFFGVSNDSAGFFGQSWQLSTWSDGTTKILNPVYNLVLDIASGVDGQPPAMLAAGADNSLLEGQHWSFVDDRPLQAVTMTTYATVTVTSPVLTSTVTGGAATSIASVYETITVTQTAVSTAAAAASSTTNVPYSLSLRLTTVLSTATTTVTVGGSTIYVGTDGAALSQTNVVTSAILTTTTVTALNVVVPSAVNQTITASPSTANSTMMTSSSTSKAPLSTLTTTAVVPAGTSPTSTAATATSTKKSSTSHIAATSSQLAALVLVTVAFCWI